MTTILPKGKKVTGTKKNDKITWTNSKLWNKALTVNAGNGNDVINFKKSIYKNKLNGGSGKDTIYGGKKNDTIHGNAGKDKLYGYDGNDKIYGDAGDDTINGGKGSNSLYFSANGGNDTVLNGGGTDTLIFSSESNINNIKAKYSNNDVIVTYSGGTVNLKDYKKVTHSAKYIQVGSSKRLITDLLKTDDKGKHLIGTNGNDVLNGTNKDDIIHGKLGSDKIYGKGGNDILESFIDAYIEGGDGNDYINTEYGFSTLYGGNGNDTINAGKCHNKVYGEDGNDSISSGYASYIDGGKGDDYIYISGDTPEKSEVYGGEGNDSIYVYTNYSYIYGGKNDKNVYSGNDTISNDGSYNHIYAEDGDNDLSISGHDNIVSAGNGNDTVTSYGYNNIVNLGTGDITLDLSYSYESCKANIIRQSDAVVSGEIIDNAEDYTNVVFLTNGKNTINVGSNNYISSGSGNDIINIKGSNNTIYCGDGENVINLEDNYNPQQNKIYGGKNNDTYSIDFWVSTRTNFIADEAGNDSIIFDNSYGSTYYVKFYINVYKNKTFDNDLVMYNSFNDKLIIQNYMGDGKIETIQTSDGYTINDSQLSSIITDVGNWLSTRSYADVQAVIDSGNTTDINTIISKFTTAWVK